MTVRVDRKARVLFRSLATVAIGLLLFGATTALAKTRHALVVGVGAYKEASGLKSLAAPPTDAELVKVALESQGVDFIVDVLKDSDIRDKDSFESALKRFLGRVKSGDDVLFYFSGHGFSVPDKGNFFLLESAKSQAVYLKDLGNAAARDLDTQDKKDRKYAEWISDIALSETAIEAAINAVKPDVIIIIIDACRNLIGDTKGASVVTSGIGLPREISIGTYRLYSASRGQVSLDTPDRGRASRLMAQDAKRDEKKDDKKPDKREASLFTRVLLNEMQTPRLEIGSLFRQVKRQVRDQARNQGVEQIPDYYESQGADDYFLRQVSSQAELTARCSTARTEMDQLRFAVRAGGIGRDQIEAKRAELAPCSNDFAIEIDKMLRLDGQGAGALSSTSLGQFVSSAKIDDPIELCEVIGSSPFDPNRQQGIAGFDVQQIALAAVGKPDDRAQAVEAMQRAIAGCESAVQARPRVARYKFNLARTHYALATLTDDKLVRQASLVQASKHTQDAADLGYVAAYNNLALMYQNGEFYETGGSSVKALAPDRGRAFNYLKRGADQNHVVALYNLGMAYKNGELGLEVSPVTNQPAPDALSPTSRTRAALSFQYLSRAAEGGYVPAMIETAILLHDWRDIPPNPKRAVELLETAASRGSWEAMYWLGQIYYIGALRDFPMAAIWYARAAEAGDSRSQTRLASMLLSGQGLPAAQPDAAGRYLRLSSDAGSIEAQMLLAGRLKENRISFRPRTDGKIDGGAWEIRSLYESAFARGRPEAGLHLARLFRTGFPVDRPSDVIPKSAPEAARLLWDTIDKVRNADPSAAEADPRFEVEAAVELIKMYDAGETSGVSGANAITQDQIDQLKSDYGDVSRLKLIKTSFVGTVFCPNGDGDHWEFWSMVWDGKKVLTALDAQFDWFERRYKCKDYTKAERDLLKDEKKAKDVVKDTDRGVVKRTRDVFKREFEAAQKDKDKKRSFVDRMVDLVSADKKKSN